MNLEEIKSICDEIYECNWDYETNKWSFKDRNQVKCEDWNGVPTHYMILEEKKR